jgi:hypothetical protein
MSKPLVDVFRFRADPTSAFSYLGAIWTVEIKPSSDGEHWECTTTAPVRLMLAMGEDEDAVRRELLETGTAAVRNTERWWLCAHLVSIGMMERVEGYTWSGTGR